MFSLHPKIIAEAVSQYSGKIKVVEGWGFRNLSTDVIQHSGGIVEEIWEKGMKNRVKNDARWLVLGVAGGCVLKLIAKKYRPKRILGIEIDPVIIEMGKKYFAIDQIPATEIIQGDANKYVYETSEKFDYVLGDLFESDSPPKFVYEQKFLSRLKEIGGTVFINHIYDEEMNMRNANKLVNTINALGYRPGTKRVLKNIVIEY